MGHREDEFRDITPVFLLARKELPESKNGKRFLQKSGKRKPPFNHIFISLSLTVFHRNTVPLPKG